MKTKPRFGFLIWHHPSPTQLFLHLFRPELKKIKTNFKKIKFNFKKMKTNFKNLKSNFKNMKSNFKKIKSIFKLVCMHKIVNIITISSVSIHRSHAAETLHVALHRRKRGDIASVKMIRKQSVTRGVAKKHVKKHRIIDVHFLQKSKPSQLVVWNRGWILLRFIILSIYLLILIFFLNA